MTNTTQPIRLMTTRSHLGSTLLVLLFLAGCERTTSDAPAKLRPCTELGQTCEFSPGKLGSCVVVDGCKRENCFVCQSQH